jgi:hypothetical protein
MSALNSRYESEGNDFPYRTVTGDESWVHYYDPEIKSQSLKYRHPTSPRKIKFSTQPSAGKCMLRVFWDYTGIIHLEQTSMIRKSTPRLA